MLMTEEANFITEHCLHTHISALQITVWIDLSTQAVPLPHKKVVCTALSQQLIRLDECIFWGSILIEVYGQIT